MNGLVPVGIVAGGLAVYAGVYLAIVLASRPARVDPGPATPDLGDEPPAVVSLLANRWRLTDDAAESTLLDLAARGYLELRQLDDNPYHTTVHLRTPPEDAPPLLPYEKRVLDRVRTLAVDGMVPVTALVFRDSGRERRWTRALHREIVDDARSRGLSQRRVRPFGMTAIMTGAGFGGGGFTVAGLLNDDSLIDALKVGIAFFVVLAGLALRPLGERDTPRGREVAARWLGVREWLRGHEEFANLPPSAVAVWDRYLSYGAALGVTRTASAVLDLGLGDHRRVWSSYGGRWQRVRVRYPRFWPRYGQSAPMLLLRGLLIGFAGYAVVRFGEQFTLPDLRLPRDPETAVEIVLELVPWIGLALLVFGGYLCLRTIIDLATARTIRGEVLWRKTWKRRKHGETYVPYLDHLAVYDGAGDRTVAWVAPHSVVRSVEAGDVVRVRVRPWSRRVVSVTLESLSPARDTTEQPGVVVDPSAAPVVGGPLSALVAWAAANLVPSQRGPIAQPASKTAAAAPSPVGSASPGAPSAGGGPSATAGPAALLTAEEIGHALGVPVQGPQMVRVPGLGRVASFTTVDGGRQALTVATVDGMAGQALWRRVQRERPAGAPTGGPVVVDTGAAARVGDTTVLLSLPERHRATPDALSSLLQQAVARLARTDDATASG